MRSEVIEAMAVAALQRVYHGRDRETLREWVYEDHPENDLLDDAEAQLGGLLDYLEAHADKWGYRHMEPPGIRDLIATLRGGYKSPGVSEGLGHREV